VLVFSFENLKPSGFYRLPIYPDRLTVTEGRQFAPPEQQKKTLAPTQMSLLPRISEGPKLQIVVFPAQ
jgi:hypothetical protein